MHEIETSSYFKNQISIMLEMKLLIGIFKKTHKWEEKQMYEAEE